MRHSCYSSGAKYRRSTQRAEGHRAEKLRRQLETASLTKDQASPDKINSPVTLICYDPFACLAGCSVSREDGGQCGRAQGALAKPGSPGHGPEETMSNMCWESGLSIPFHRVSGRPSFPSFKRSWKRPLLVYSLKWGGCTSKSVVHLNHQGNKIELFKPQQSRSVQAKARNSRPNYLEQALRTPNKQVSHLSLLCRVF